MKLTIASLLALAATTVNAGTVQTCDAQFPCVRFTMRYLGVAGDASVKCVHEGDCAIEVCILVDNSSVNSQCSQTGTFVHMCDAAGSDGCPIYDGDVDPVFDIGNKVSCDYETSGYFGTEGSDAICNSDSSYMMCQEGRPGQSLFWILRDGTGQNQALDQKTYDATSYPSGMSAKIPFDPITGFEWVNSVPTVQCFNEHYFCGATDRNGSKKNMERTWQFTIPQNACTEQPVDTGNAAPLPGGPGPQVDVGGACTVWFNPSTNGGQGAFKPYSGNPDFAKMCMPQGSDNTYLSCIPDDDSGDYSGWTELPGTCRSRACNGLDDTDGIDVDNIPIGEDHGTRRVTICHRTCSENNPWVRITIDYHAFEADNGICGGEDGNDHTRHNVTEDCGVTDLTPWGGRDGDYLIRYHGSRAEVAANFANLPSGETYEGFATEKEYWSYWERACPSVRANKGAKSCCFDDDCCGYGAQTAGPTFAPTPATPTFPPGSNGDPHFKTWKNEHYEYHGQCDLVLTKDPNFADGLGLDIQIRTKLVRFWSYIKNAAIRIGEDVLEVEGSPDTNHEFRYWYNLEYRGEMKTVGGFPVTVTPACPTCFWKTRVEIDLSSRYPGNKIIMQTYKEFIKVAFEGATAEAFGNTVGMLGDFNNGKTLARDGSTELSDFWLLGNEWQVLPVEPMLFHDISHPQFPERCLEPEDPQGERRRRLDESSVSEEQAEKACSHLKDPLDRKDCVYDILATQDLDMVGAY